VNATHPKRFRTVRTSALALIGALGFYVATAGAVPAIARHMEDGRLQWLRSSSGAAAFLQVYEWPARRLAVLPGVHWAFELSAAFWCCITGAPETTG
jgi:hypothetical protein